MDRELLMHLPVVACVAEHQSFAAAASRLGMSPSAVSHAVRQIEGHLGDRLFTRTTRSVALTEAGRAFLAQVLPALDSISNASEAAQARCGRVSGVLRINAPRVAQVMVLPPLLLEMSQRHPALTIEVVCDDALVDIVAQGFDAGIRLGEMIAADMVAVRLTPPMRAIMVASSAYLQSRPPLHAPGDLQGHNCIGYRLLGSGAVYAWELQEQGRDLSVEVHGSARVTDPLFALDLALAGVGIAYLFEPLAEAALASGRLVEVLPQCALQEPGLFLYFPRRAAEAPSLRALIDLIRERAIDERA